VGCAAGWRVFRRLLQLTRGCLRSRRSSPAYVCWSVHTYWLDHSAGGSWAVPVWLHVRLASRQPQRLHAGMHIGASDQIRLSCEVGITHTVCTGGAQAGSRYCQAAQVATCSQTNDKHSFTMYGSHSHHTTHSITLKAAPSDRKHQPVTAAHPSLVTCSAEQCISCESQPVTCRDAESPCHKCMATAAGH
jgi:hypothetical protein